MCKTIYCICGKTASGKDTIAEYLSNALDIPQIVSFTTRPPRPGEESQNRHIFITDEECDKMLSDQKIAAYTKIGDYRYFTTVNQIEAIFETCDDMIYVIDPNGMASLINALQNTGIRTVVIYIKADDYDIRRQRYLERGGTVESFIERNISERDQFELLQKFAMFDYAVTNDDLFTAEWVAESIVMAEQRLSGSRGTAT